MEYPFDCRNSFESYMKEALAEFRANVKVVCGDFDLEPEVSSAFSKYVEGMLAAFGSGNPDSMLMFDELEANSRILKGALALKCSAMLLTKFDRLMQNLSFGVRTLY